MLHYGYNFRCIIAVVMANILRRKYYRACESIQRNLAVDVLRTRPCARPMTSGHRLRSGAIFCIPLYDSHNYSCQIIV